MLTRVRSRLAAILVFAGFAFLALPSAAWATGPIVTQNPVDQTVNAGQTATFTAAASGTPTPTVQWQSSTDGGATFQNVAGATTTTLTVPNVVAGQNGTKFRAVFTNVDGSATTTAATLTVNFAPTVTTNPVSQSISAGSTVTFTAAASGNPTPTVQWQQSTDGGATFQNIAGATSTTLSFTALAGQNGNQYRAVFTNSVGSATTTAATLTVTAGPQITTNPTDQTVNAGQTATFTAAASGTPTPTVQWQSSTDGGATFQNVAGATTTTLTVPNVVAGQNGNKFRAVFTNSAGSATTTAATLTVNFAPTVTTNPVSQSISAGSTVTFTAAASGNPTPTVQWQQSTDGGATFQNIAGATSTTLSFTALAGQNGNQYRAVFTNSVGSATTTAATLTVTAGPQITTNPTDQTVNAGQTATFTAAASGTPTPTVQWQSSTDGGATFQNVAGATTTTLTVPNVAASQNGTKFRAVFTNSAGSATTTAATLTVNFAPTVTTNPVSQSISAGSTVTFTAAASGNPTPTVQWQQSTDGGATFQNIAGATSTTLSFTALAGQNGNQYRAVFTNSVGSATTTAATLTVTAGPQITTNPTDQTVNAGQTATFTAAASGTPTPTVQWQSSTDGGATFQNVAGATTTTLTVPNVVASQNGTKFRAVFTNSAGSATTTAATLTVNFAPTVTTNPVSQSVSSTSNVTFTAAASGNPTPTVQWQQSTDGGATFNNIAGATSTTLNFTAQAGQNGNQYRAVFTNSVGSATTTAATLTVTNGPQITTNPTDQTVNAGQNATFTAAATGSPTPTVQWQVSIDGGATFQNVAGATTTTLTVPNVAASQNGNKYRAVFTNAGGVATTVAATLTVNFAPTVTTNPVSQSISAGSTVTFTAAASGNPTPTVQWQQSTDGGATFQNIAGATSTTLSFTALAGQNGNQYRAVFTNSVGSATTTAATLTVTAGPRITTNPTDQTVNAGQTATFTAAASGTPTPTVQWQSSTDGGATFQNVAGATTTTLTIPNVVTGQNGNKYRAVFTNGGGTATTTAATLTVNSAGPVVTTNPVNQTVTAGQTATFTAASSGTPTPTVQWQVSTDNGVTFNNIPGAASTTLSFTATTAMNGNKYRAVFTNGSGTATTTAATLTVTPPAVQSTTTTLASSLNPSSAGQAVTFTATVTASLGTPTGTVTFNDGGTPIGTGTLSGGVATFTTSALSAGTHSITASYAGNANFTASVSTALSQAVNVAADSIKLRQLQVLVTPMVSQVSGQAISGAVDSAINEGFSGGGAFMSPTGSGVRFNFSADPESGAVAMSPRSTDPFSSVGVLPASIARGPAGSPSRVDDAFNALGYAGPVKTPPPRLVEPKEWLGWAEIRGATLDHWNTSSTFGTPMSATSTLYGNQVNLIAGLSRKFTPNFLVGVLGGYETFDYRSEALSGRLRGDGWTVGAYAGWRLSSNVRMDAAVAYSGIGYDGTAGTASGTFAGNRLLASGGITGTYGAYGFRIEPSARVYALWEHENAYTDTLGTLQAARDFSTGRASGGAKVVYPFAWSDIVFAPYAGLYADYYFNTDSAGPLAVVPGAIPTGLAFDGWSARATGGLTASFNGGAQLTVGAERSGIGGNVGVWVYRARGSIPFAAH